MNNVLPISLLMAWNLISMGWLFVISKIDTSINYMHHTWKYTSLVVQNQLRSGMIFISIVGRIRSFSSYIRNIQESLLYIDNETERCYWQKKPIMSHIYSFTACSTSQSKVMVLCHECQLCFKTFNHIWVCQFISMCRSCWIIFSIYNPSIISTFHTQIQDPRYNIYPEMIIQVMCQRWVILIILVHGCKSLRPIGSFGLYLFSALFKELLCL